MFETNMLIQTIQLTKDKVIPEIAVYTIVWAASDKEAQEILAAKRPSFNFYDRLCEFLKSVGYDNIEDIKKLIAFLQLDERNFEIWAENKQEELDITDNPKSGMKA